jgi:hypothetical protein
LAKPIAFALAILPLLVLNLRTGQVKNSYILLVFASGLVIAAVSRGSDWSLSPVPLISVPWFVAASAVLIVLFCTSIIPGGVAKTLIALLPWFSILGYLFVVTAGSFAFAFFAYLHRRNIYQSQTLPVVPIVATIGMISLLWDVGSAPLTSGSLG